MLTDFRQKIQKKICQVLIQIFKDILKKFVDFNQADFQKYRQFHNFKDKGLIFFA